MQRGLLRPLSQLLWGLQQRNPMRSWDHYRIGGQIALSLGDRTQFYTRLRNTWDYDAGMYARIYADPERFRAVPREIVLAGGAPSPVLEPANPAAFVEVNSGAEQESPSLAFPRPW